MPRGADLIAGMKDLGDLPPSDNPSVDTEVRTYGLTEARTDASEEVSTAVSKDLLTEAREEVRADGSASASKGVSKRVRSGSGAADLQAFKSGIRSTIATNKNPPGGVKSTVDMSPETSNRLLRFRADNRDAANNRSIILAVVEAWLTEEGY